jgi:hypothetical protein
MNTAKAAGILGAIVCAVTFGLNFVHMHFGYYVPPPHTPLVDIYGIEAVCFVFTLISIALMILIARAPAPCLPHS